MLAALLLLFPTAVLLLLLPGLLPASAGEMGWELAV